MTLFLAKPSGVFTQDDRLLADFPSHNAARRALSYFRDQPGVYAAVTCTKHPTEPAPSCGLCSCDRFDEQERYEAECDEAARYSNEDVP